MRLRTEAYFRQVAEDALAAIAVDEPPVSVEDVAASLRIPVRQVRLSPFFTAATVYEDGLPVMVVNVACPEIEQRQALAHMLGHVLLVLADEADVFPRWHPDHSDADQVGRELIMPTRLVTEQAAIWFNDFRYLARLFAVPENLMLERLRELHLVKAQTIAWDF